MFDSVYHTNRCRTARSLCNPANAPLTSERKSIAFLDNFRRSTEHWLFIWSESGTVPVAWENRAHGTPSAVLLEKYPRIVSVFCPFDAIKLLFQIVRLSIELFAASFRSISCCPLLPVSSYSRVIAQSISCCQAQIRVTVIKVHAVDVDSVQMLI